MTIQEYFKLLKEHDWFFEFSDSHLKWQKGKDNETKLKNLGCLDIKFKKMYEDFARFYDCKVENAKFQVPEPKIENYL